MPAADTDTDGVRALVHRVRQVAGWRPHPLLFMTAAEAVAADEIGRRRAEREAVAALPPSKALAP